jgi:N-acetylglutamate synthase-like GNAT family acetyltransferase
MIEKQLFGCKNEYVNLDSLQVSYEFRRHGLGRVLFEESCKEAKRMGAKKLYISANSSEETHAFYKAMGCCGVTEINKTLFEKEPFDVHMEYDLGCT